MSPFLPKGAKTWKGRVHDRTGRRYIRSLGVPTKREASLVQAFLAECRRRRDWRTLDAVITGRIAAVDAYHASVDGSLAQQLTALESQRDEDAEPDVDTLVTEWGAHARSAKYVTQVRTMIPEGRRFPLSGFTRAAISRHLAALPCSDPTKNRYRVAFSQLARWLVERDLLTANPVRDVRGFRERSPRMVFYSRAEAMSVVRRLPSGYAAFEAFLVGAGLEVGATLGLTRRDVDLETREVQARGTKTRHRVRVVRVTEPWAWDVLLPYVACRLPDSPLFTLITERQALLVHRKAVAAAGVAPSTLHDWRHTYAVQALKDGLPAQTVKHQLGHSPHSTMLERVYAAWIPKGDADYARMATEVATSGKQVTSGTG